MTKIGKAPLTTGDLATCRRAAVEDAVRETIAVAAQRVLGGISLDADEIGQLAGDDSVVVSRDAREYDEHQGSCRAKVRVVVNADALAAAYRGMNAATLSGPVSIGVVLRYTVDGRPAEQAGFDVQYAQNELSSRLHDNGLRPMMLTRIADNYQRKRRNVAGSVGSDDGDPTGAAVAVTSSMSDDDVKDMLKEARAWARQGGAAAAGGPNDINEYAALRYVTLGDIRIRRKGVDKHAPVYLAGIEGQLRIVEVHPDNTVVDTGFSGVLNGTMEGDDQHNAVNNAMRRAAVEAAAKMVGQLRRNAKRGG